MGFFGDIWDWTKDQYEEQADREDNGDGGGGLLGGGLLGGGGSSGSGGGQSGDGIGGALYDGISAIPGGKEIMDGAAKLLGKIWPGWSWKSNGFNQMEEVLGEKYMYHVLGADITNRNLVPADKIAEAKQFMPALFGVPLYDALDMNALEVSVAEYQKSPRAQGVPVSAIERAVFLKKSCFPYSKRKWDVRDAQKYPLVGYDFSEAAGTGDVKQLGAAGGGKVSSGIWVGIGIFLAGILAIFQFMGKKKNRRY